MSEAPFEFEQAQAGRSPAGVIQANLYCLHCGYNLRGLSGDPVRCPECGYMNPLGDVELPADQISRQLRRMETAPAVSVLGLLLLAPALPWMVAMAVGRDAGVGGCPGVLALAAFFMWLSGLLSFRQSCLRQSGWVLALIRYQLVAAGLAGLVVAIFLAGTVYMEKDAWRLNRYLGEHWPCLALPLLFGTVMAGIVRGLRPIHRWLKAPMEQLQRRVAVTMARDHIRRRLATRRRWRR